MQNSCQNSFLESIFRLESFVKTKDAFNVEHQQTTEADQNEQKYNPLLLQIEISLFLFSWWKPSVWGWGGLLYVDDEIIQLRMTHNTSNARCNEDII